MKRFLPLLLLLFAPAAFAQFNVLIDGNFPLCQDTAGQHLNWNGNFPGGGPVCGTSTGPATPPVIGSPTSRSLSLATAFQATDNTKPAIVTVNVSSTATITLTTGTTNTSSVVVGSTSGVASGTGSNICPYTNSQTGTLVVGANLSTVSTGQCTFILPAGWFFAVRQIAGTVTISSAFDQSIG